MVGEGDLEAFVAGTILAYHPEKHRLAYFCHTRSPAYEQLCFLELKPRVRVFGLPLGPEKSAQSTIAAHHQAIEEALVGYVRIEGASFDQSVALLSPGNVVVTLASSVLTVNASGGVFAQRVGMRGFGETPVIAAAIPETSLIAVVVYYEDFEDILDRTVPYVVDVASGSWF
jgi:hypothetical protein